MPIRPSIRRSLPLLIGIACAFPALPLHAQGDASPIANAPDAPPGSAAPTAPSPAADRPANIAPPSVQTSVAPPEAREVVAEGRAAIGAGGLVAARGAAEAQALRNAVEKTTGVFVSAHTLTHNYELVRDQIVTHAEGFATLKQVLHETDGPDTVAVTIRALVSLRPLAQELKQLNLTRAWRVRVSLVGADGGALTAMGPDRDAIDALEKSLLEAGFVVVSKDGDADIAVHVTSQMTSTAYVSSYRALSSTALHAVRDSLSVRATRAQTGEVVAVFSAANGAGNNDLPTARSEAAINAVQAIAPRLSDALMLLPARESLPIQLVVVGIGTAARATHLEAALNKMTGVRAVTRRSYRGGEAVWELDVITDAQPDLARELEESAGFKKFKLSVTSDTLARIVAKAPFGGMITDEPAEPKEPAVPPVPEAPETVVVAAVPAPTPPISVTLAAPSYRSLHHVWKSAAAAPKRNYNFANAAPRVNPKDGAEMVWIPSGAFEMGDNDMPTNPRHTVTLSGYYIYKDLVTVGMYRHFCAESGRAMPALSWTSSRSDDPMVDVTWDDACAYCMWAGVRLPSEAEWEKAARGTEAYKFPWGNDFRRLRRSGMQTQRGAAPVGTIPDAASPYGVLDMDGEALQWCADGYDPLYQKASPMADPEGPERSRERVLRGCTWSDWSTIKFRTALRSHIAPTAELKSIGFRAAASPHESALTETQTPQQAVK